MDSEIRDISPLVVEAFTKTEEKPDKVKVIWPSKLLFWCNVCTQNYTISKKSNNGEFEEQLICQHMVLKKVVK